MKKILALILCLVTLLSLAACGGNQEETPAGPVPETTEEELDDFALAESCIDKSVDELFALIGEPESSDYAPSCMGDGEDGNLYYEYFTVYTYREGDEETVVFVE